MKKIIRVLSILILLGIFIGIIYYAVSTSKFNFKSSSSSPQLSRGLHRDVSVNRNNPTMLHLGSFTTNMSQNGRASKFVITELSALTSDDDVSYELKEKNILVRDIILKEMSLKTFSQISSNRGKDQLKASIITQLNRILEEGTVQEIYFTKFIVQ